VTAAQPATAARPPAAAARPPAAAARRGWAPRLALAVKRVLDVSVAATLLVVCALPLLVLGLIMRASLRGPALFRQVRVVGHGRLAEILKIRTLRAHGNPDTCWITPLGQSSTRLGRFLRATHVDELPQLVNVLRGELSLVGPRPERPYFHRRFAAEIPGYEGRTRMKAGLTGWAQVHGLTGNTSITDRAALDNAYIDNWSLRLDLAILARTAWLVILAAAGLRPAASTATSPTPAPAGAASSQGGHS
jgi:lipopolysaccharide/colanic/teichoic acid biosynthesis glycosyltransferase